MRVEQNYAMSEIIQRQDTTNKTENEQFASILNKSVEDSSGYKVIKSVTDADVENFLDKLTSMGASAFWLNLNLEKIQDKVDEKRKELMDKLGLNDESVELSAEDKQASLDELNEMLEDYIKELLEQYNAKEKLKESVSSSPLTQIFGENNPLSI